MENSGKKLLVVINGKAGSGKDTFVEMCRDYARTYAPGLRVYNIHRSDAAKRMLLRMGWNEKKTPEVRQLLADIVDFGETTGFNSTNLYTSVINSEGLIFYHARDPKTIEKIVNHYAGTFVPVVTMYVDRDTDATEKDRWNQKSYDYDYIINNDKDLECLFDRVVAFMDKFLELWR